MAVTLGLIHHQNIQSIKSQRNRRNQDDLAPEVGAGTLGPEVVLEIGIEVGLLYM